MDFIENLQEAWSEESNRLERRGLDSWARFQRSFAVELLEARREWLNATLTLEEAAVESGYTKEHLGRLVREGTIPNAGTKGSPLILRRHLPRKPGHGITSPGAPEHKVGSRTQMARSVVNS